MKKLLSLLLLASLPALAKDELHLYNWNDYIAPETVERFEKSCKCKVVQDYFGDNEEVIAKFAAGAKGYDVIVPTSNYVAGMAKAGWLQPLDKSKIPNFKNVMPQYLNTEFDPGNKYSAPYAMSITLIGYNEQKMKELGITVDSWAVIFDPKILAKIKGRVTVLDSQSELMAAALKYLGYSVNDRDPKHWKQASDVIVKAKPYWAAFMAQGYIKELIHRKSLGGARLLERHLPGRPRGAGSQAEVPHPPQPAEGRCGAGAGRDGDREDRAAAGPCAPVHQFHARRQELRGPHQHDRLGQSEYRRNEDHQAGDQEQQGGIPGCGIGEAAGAVEGHDAQGTPAAQPHLDRDQGEIELDDGTGAAA